MSASFFQDLRAGQEIERVVEDILRAGGMKVYPGSGDYAYDRLVINNRRAHLVEVKDESCYTTSQNLCIELSAGSERTPAGLFKTEASLQIHYFSPERCVMFKTKPMLLFVMRGVETKKLEITGFENGDNGVRGVLVPFSWLAGKDWADVIPSSKLAKSKLWGREMLSDLEFGG